MARTPGETNCLALCGSGVLGVGVQGEARRAVTQHPGHCFHIYPVSQRQGGEVRDTSNGRRCAGRGSGGPKTGEPGIGENTPPLQLEVDVLKKADEILKKRRAEKGVNLSNLSNQEKAMVSQHTPIFAAYESSGSRHMATPNVSPPVRVHLIFAVTLRTSRFLSNCMNVERPGGIWFRFSVIC